MTTINFIMLSLFLIEIALSAYILYQSSVKDPDDILFMMIWPLFELIKAGGFLVVFKSDAVYIVVALFYMIDFVIISAICGPTTNTKDTRHKIKF